MSYKTINGLMRHLRDNGVKIEGGTQKRQLINTGYYHGYKGYRFFQTAQNRLPFSSWEEVYATVQYDSRLKALFYDKMMFIETAVKNVSLQCILEAANSEDIQVMYDRVISDYNSSPASLGEKARKEIQKRKLRLQSSIQSNLERAYGKRNPKITHFYENLNYRSVPLWALFEILMMGDLAYLLECLNFSTRDAITEKLRLNKSADTNRELIYKYLYAFKDLRNAIAHNAVVFDARFRSFKPTKAMCDCLVKDVGLPYVNFKTIGDYLILMCYYLKNLGVGKTELRAFVREFEKITKEYTSTVNPAVGAIVIHPDLSSRLQILKKYIG
jgi:abortive infection bacteriophage resistance protein